MPVYEFVTTSGKVVEAFFSMAVAPRIGDVITLHGEKATRIVRPPQVSVHSTEEFTSYQVHRKHPAIKKRDKKGRAVFSGSRDVDQFCERTRELAETKDPSIPSYEFNQIASMEQSDKDAHNAKLMKHSKSQRQVGEAMRGMGFISTDTFLEGE